MKIATYNVENMFRRTRVFNQPDAGLARQFSLDSTELNLLFERPTYSAADKKRMVELFLALGLAKADRNKFATFRSIRGSLFKRVSGKPMEIIASGRESWIGWVELEQEPVNAVAIQNTARVIRDVNPDILAVMEVEDRRALRQFNDHVLTQVGGRGYEHIMVIEGNDERGIDVGVMTREQYPLRFMWSHVHEKSASGFPLFSRDAPEYEVRTPDGERIWVIPCHFKSKFGGDNAASRKKRAMQAEKVAEIYTRLRKEGDHKIVVLGDFNDTPESASLRRLLKETDLKDVSLHPSFDTGTYKGQGTFGPGTAAHKIDYLLLSPELFKRISACGIYRKGAWPGSGARPRWEVYPELKREEHAASDHHLLWAELV